LQALQYNRKIYEIFTIACLPFYSKGIYLDKINVARERLYGKEIKAGKSIIAFADFVDDNNVRLFKKSGN
jgi:hypothetical protein